MAAAHADNFVVRLGCGGLLRVQWHTRWSRPTTNPEGTTGWVTVIGYHGEQPAPAADGDVTRLHVCKHIPCGAVHPPSKYGCFPVPIHGHLACGAAAAAVAVAATAPDATAAAAAAAATAPDATAAAAAVAATASEAAAAAAAAAVTAPDATAAAAAVAATAPEATAAAAAAAATAPDATAAAAAVAATAPGRVALPTDLQPAPHHGQMGRFPVHRVPLPRQLVAQPLALATASAPAPPGCGDIRAAMEAHAHYLRCQRTFVGQFALVLFCISRGVRLHLWEGRNRTDLVSLYAPWAAEHCPEEKTLAADVIAVVLSDGELHYICDTVPLSRVNHFVLGEPLVPVSGDASGSHGSGEAASWCDVFYQRF